MNFKRERKAFTREELTAIEAEATAKGLDLIEQMAGVMLTAETWFEKETEKVQLLLSAAEVWLAASRPPEDTIAERLYLNLKEAVEGMTGDPRDPELVFARQTATGFVMGFRTHWASRLIAASVAKSLKKPDGTYWNNISYELHDPTDGETYFVEVQRKTGKTAAQQRTEAEAERDEARRLVTMAGLVSQIATRRDDGMYIIDAGSVIALRECDEASTKFRGGR
jgi:hypothetical protein